MSNSSNIRFSRLVAILAAVALLAAACDSDTTGDTTADTTGEATATTEVTGSTAGTTPESTPSSGQPFIYRIGITSDITTTNYWRHLGGDTTFYNAYVLEPAKNGLFRINLPSLAVVPALAEGLPAEPIADGEVWTVTQPLQHGIRWSDGVEFTAADVVFTYEAVRDGGLRGSWLSSFPYSEDSSPRLLDVEALDDYTVKMTFDVKPDLGTWPHNVGVNSIMSAAYWGDTIAEALGAENPSAKIYAADGSGDPSIGPMVFESRSEGAFIVNAANADYSFSGRQTTVYEDGTVEIDGERYYGSGGGNVVTSYTDGPYASQTIYSVYADEAAAMLALTEGEIDYWISPLGVSPGLAVQGKESEALSVATNPTNRMRYLGFNLRESPGSYKSFRQAVLYMIDREFLAQEVLQGVVLPMYVMVPESNQRWFNNEFAAEVKERYAGLPPEDRLNAAVSLLKADGFTWDVEPRFDPGQQEIIPGSGLKDPTGVTVPEIEILAPPDSFDPLRAKASLWIEVWLEQLGVPARVSPTEINAMAAKVWPGPDEEITFDMYIVGWNLGNSALPTFHESFWHSRWLNEVNDGNNSTGFVNAEFDTAADAILAAETEGAMYDLIWEAESILADELPYVVLFNQPITEFFSNDLRFPFIRTLSGLQYGNGFPGLVQKMPAGNG